MARAASGQRFPRLRRLLRPRALHGKLVMLVLTSLGLGLSIACLGTYMWMRTFLLGRVDTQLSSTARFASAAIAQHRAAGQGLPAFSGDSDDIASNWNSMSLAGLLPSYLEVRDPSGRIVRRVGGGAAAPVLPADPAARIPSGAEHVVFDLRGSAQDSGASFRVRVDRLQGAGTLVLAMPVDDVRRTLTQLEIAEVAVWSMAFALVGWIATRRIRSALRPLERIGGEALAIGAGDLDRRVTPTDAETEVGRLAIAVNTMLGRLEAAFAERRASEERLRRFVADASHELRTPLTSIRGYAELFRRGAAERPQDLALAMSRIESEAARMGSMVDELLLLARLDSGRPLEREPVDLVRLAADAVSDFRVACPQWPVELDVSPAVIRGDTDRLRQVLANLLANVRQHTPPGTESRLSVRMAGTTAVIEVADSGPGITAEQCERVFERFYRADASRARSASTKGGAGLGLSIVHAVAAAHGGSAHAHPHPGGGLVVGVEIPRSGSSAGEQPFTAGSQPPHSPPASARAVMDPEPETGRGGASTTMEALSRWVVKHRRLVGLLWLGALIAGVFAASGLSGRLDKSFSMPGQKGYVANQAILKQYGNGAGQEPLVPVVTLPAGSGVDDPVAAAALAKAFGEIGSVPGFRVASYADTHDRAFVAADGRTTFGLVYPRLTQVGFASDDVVNAATDQVAAVLRKDLPTGTEVDVTGTIPLQLGAASSKSGGPGVLAETLIGGLGALAVLAFVFASFLALVPLLVAAVSILTSFLVVFGLTEFMKVSSLVQFLVALIGLGVAIDYSLLLVTRWREELAHGHDNETAVHNAMATAGRAVAFSGVTVGLGLIALVLLPVPFLRSMGVGGMVIPLVSVAVTLTLVPALLTGWGRRLDWPKLRKEGQAARGWTAWARLIVRRRWAAAVAALAVLGFLGVNALNMQIGATKSTSLSQSGPAREGLDTLTAAGITSGVLTPIEVVVPRGHDAAAVAGQISAVGGVHAAIAPAAWKSAESSLIEVLPARETATSASRTVVNQVRTVADRAAPGALTGGSGALQADMVRAVYGNFPLMLTAVAIITFLLLVRAFRSILLPLKAVVLNLLSVGAIYGVVTLVWQDGHGSQAIGGIPATGAVTGWIPLMIFAFLYGLSMDYEVFILARMREEYDRTGSTTTAVVEGIGRTGRLVTSAALILFLAFASLASGPEVQLKVFATGLGAGILLDATVVRALLVPALVSLFGRWNWWLPGWAAKVLRVETSPAKPEAEPAFTPEPAGAR